MLLDLEKSGLNAVRKYSAKFDDWTPSSLELSESQIQEAIERTNPQVVRDTDFCQANMRRFARAQLKTFTRWHSTQVRYRHVCVTLFGQHTSRKRKPPTAA